jgi:hypothetical protein
VPALKSYKKKPLWLSKHTLIPCDAAVFVRAVNTLLVTRRKDVFNLRFPPNGVTYRGGGLPDKYRAFYHVGKQFRVAGFFSSSFSRDTAVEFMSSARMREEPCVLWEIHMDPAGERLLNRRCMQVSFIERTNEYLYAPYAPFTVKHVSHESILVLVSWMHIRACQASASS